jgi:ATP-dependent Clp protease adaptor protein ClpS
VLPLLHEYIKQGGPVSIASVLERPDLDEVTETEDDIELPYVIVLFDDYITPHSVVVFALCRIFSYTKIRANEIVQTAHREKKAIAYHGTKENCERYCIQLHLCALIATVSRG